MPLAQRCFVHVSQQGLLVGAVEVDARAQLLPQEWLEQREQHVEYVGLVHNVDRFKPDRCAVLEWENSFFR